MHIVLGVGIGVAVIAVAILGLYLWSQQRVMDRDGMIAWKAEDEEGNALSLSYLRISESGDSLGCHYSWEIVATEPGTAKVTVTQQPTHSSREKTFTKKVGGNLLRDIQAIIEEYGMTGWDDLPEAEIFALDAASTWVSFEYDGAEHSFGSGDELPSGGWAAIREIQALLESAAGVK